MENAVVLQPAQDAETKPLIALLEDALSSETMRRAMLADTSLTYYTAYRNAELVVVRWGDDGEIELLAVDAAGAGRGSGGRLPPKS